jgi:hypothetical protein
MPAPIPSSAASRGSLRPSRRLLHAFRPVLAPNTASPRPSLRVPWGLVGAILLIALIESSISKRWLWLTDPVGLSWRFSTQAASTLAPGCDLLCLGDSLIKHGVIPSVLQSASGLRCTNLSAARCPTLMTYYLFRQALNAGARPRAILINAKPAVLLGDPSFNSQYWPYGLTLFDYADFALRARRPQLVASTLVAELLPSLRSRLQVRSSVMAALQGTTDRLEEINPVLWRNWTVNSGANVAQSTIPFDGELPSDVEMKLHPTVFFAHPSNEFAIRQILELASDRGVHVYFLLAPLSPALQALRDKSGAESRYEQFIAKFQKRFPEILTILDARRAGFENRDFIDATHMNERGATALSVSIAAALTPPQNRSKETWIAVSVPRFTAQSLQFDLEDIDQSRDHVKKSIETKSASTSRSSEDTIININ